MSIAVDFYRFSKKVNSTKRPGNPSVTYNCNLIEPCSIINPVIALTGTNSQFNPSSYNYARIATFDRHYFVNDWVYDGGRWIAKLNIDALASWKNNILSSEQYVTRSSTTYNKAVVDNTYPTLSYCTTRVSTADFFDSDFVSDVRSGVCVVVVRGVDENTQDPLLDNIYIFDFPKYADFRNQFFNIITTITNPLQYIARCFWLPIAYGTIPGSEVTSVKVGITEINNILCKKPTRSTIIANWFFNLEQHPQYNDYGWWLSASPFTRRSLYWQPCGLIPLETSKITSANPTITIHFTIDFHTGKSIFVAESDTSSLLYSGEASIGVELSLSQQYVNALGVAGSVITTVANAFAENWAGVAGGVVSGVSNALPQMAVNGGTATFAYLNIRPKIITEFYSLVDTDRNRFGRPLYKTYVLQELGDGYYTVENATISFSCTDIESLQIKEYMEGGFYIE